VGVTTYIRLTDVVAEDHENVGLLGLSEQRLWHRKSRQQQGHETDKGRPNKSSACVFQVAMSF
jgi:hypothetical protein